MLVSGRVLKFLANLGAQKETFMLQWQSLCHFLNINPSGIGGVVGSTCCTLNLVKLDMERGEGQQDYISLDNGKGYQVYITTTSLINEHSHGNSWVSLLNSINLLDFAMAFFSFSLCFALRWTTRRAWQVSRKRWWIRRFWFGISKREGSTFNFRRIRWWMRICISNLNPKGCKNETKSHLTNG